MYVKVNTPIAVKRNLVILDTLSFIVMFFFSKK